MTRHKHDPEPVALSLAAGGQTLVDPDIAEKLGGKSVHAASRGRYAAVSVRGRDVYLHHFVMGRPPRAHDVDHRNGDGFDNRRANLRVISHQRNIWAQAHLRPGTSRFRGVFWHKPVRRWRVGLGWHGRRYGGGTFRSEVMAALARDDLAMKVTGLREGLNFPLFVRRPDVGGFLRATRGRLFRVWFRKRTDGSVRSMLCRTGVHLAARQDAHASGARGLPFEPPDRNLLSVYEFATPGYRFVPLEGVLAVRFAGRQYRVVPGPMARGPGNESRATSHQREV